MQSESAGGLEVNRTFTKGLAEAARNQGPGNLANQNQRGCTNLLPAPNLGQTSPGGGRRASGVGGEGLPLWGPRRGVDCTARGGRRREEGPAPAPQPGSSAQYSRGLHGSKLRAAGMRKPDAGLYWRPGKDVGSQGSAAAT